MAPKNKGLLPKGSDDKFLTFFLADSEYCVQILKVREISGLVPLSPLPDHPEYIIGQARLGGQNMPVADLRRRLGLPETEYNTQTCIIVLETKQPGGSRQIGLVVDGVSEVVSIPDHQLKPVSSAKGMEVDQRFVSAWAQTKSGPKILLRLDQVLADDE